MGRRPITDKGWNTKAEISTAENQNTGTIHHGLAALHYNNSDGGCLPSHFTLLLVICLPLVLLISGCYGELTGSNIRANGSDYGNANHKM